MTLTIRDEAFLKIGKQCLELAGCRMRKTFMGENFGYLYEVVRPDDGITIPPDSAIYRSEEEAWLGASKRILLNEKTCIEVLVEAFKTPVSFEYQKIEPHQFPFWSAYVPVHKKCEQGQHLWEVKLYSAVAKTLPLAIALCFLSQRGVSIENEVFKALEAKE